MIYQKGKNGKYTKSENENTTEISTLLISLVLTTSENNYTCT